MSWDIYVFITLVSVMLMGYLYVFYKEKKSYNNGICPHCGMKLKHFHTNPYGARGYCCPNKKHKYLVWVTWPGVDGWVD